MLVLAGPGSGKTTVISERVRYLIEEKGVSPEHILTITFTKTAALEMQRRCQRICPRAESAVFGTFHSVFYHFLRRSDKYHNFTLINEKQKKEMMRKLIPCGSMTPLQHLYVCEQMLKKISCLKNSWAYEAEDMYVLQTKERYCRLCEEQQKLDFDDMLLLCYRLFTEHEEELKKWQKRFLYVLVDEFQDINRCQYEIVKLLVQMHGNIFAVGDDDQAIYSFRGSDPGFMKRFIEDFSLCKQIYLEENYRCGSEIVEVAGKSIGKNRNRFIKSVRAKGEFENHVHRKRFRSAEEEAAGIATEIKRRRAQESKKQSIAVLVRTNAQAGYIAEQFYQNEIPCIFKERKVCFYEQPVIIDLLSVLRFAVCGQKRSDFFVFMNKPFRGIERAMLEEEQVELNVIAMRLEERGNRLLAKEINMLERKIHFIQEMDPYGALTFILHGLKYDTYLEALAGEDEKVRQQIDETIRDLLMRAHGFKNIALFLSFVEKYIACFHEEEADGREKQAKSEDAIELLTYHGAKGLEFDCVFLPMLNDGMVPRGRMLTQEQMEEERRMFYVAMTRAKCNLYLSWTGKEEGMEASVFLRELETDAIGT